SEEEQGLQAQARARLGATARVVCSSLPAQPNAGRHLGVALLLSERLSRHVRATDDVTGTAILAKALFRGRQLWIVVAYVPPRGAAGDDQDELRRRTTAKVLRWRAQAIEAGADMLLLGDFNDVTESSGEQARAGPQTPLLRALTEDASLCDA